MNLNIFLDPIVWIALAVASLAALLALWGRFIPIWAAGSAAGSDNETEYGPDAESEESEEPEPESISKPDENTYFPKLSVIVYSYSEFEETKEYLDMALSQDYPNYEVILVNEGNAESTGMLHERLGKEYDNLYITFVPYDAHNLSRRKLAFTLGMKAASGDCVLTTVANCRIPSRRWLSEMMRPFLEDSTIDIVLGYTHLDFSELHGAWKWYRQMDATLTACQWIGSAQMGNPYRGDCFNLAYKREIFFNQKGYSRTIHLVNGDDDIFLSPVMDGYNTAVAISPDTILTTEWGETANAVLSDTKERYLFTARFLPPLPFMRAGMGSLMQWLTLLAVAGGAIAAWPSYTGIIIAAIFLTVLWTSEILIYRRTARRLQSVGLWWSLPFFLLWHPFGNLIFRLRHNNHRKNFTFA